MTDQQGSAGNVGNPGEGAHGGTGGTGGAGGVGIQGIQGKQGIQGERYSSWLTRHVMKAYLLLAGGIVAAFVLMGIGFARVEDDRQRRLNAVTQQADTNRTINRDLCEGLNGSNETLRFLLDGALRGRTPTSPPLTDSARQLTIDTYRRLPSTNCETGEKTYHEPPLPPPTGVS